MCFATIGMIGATVSAAGTLVGAVAQSDAASYQAEVASNNAKIAQQNATYAEQAGNAKVQQAGLQSAEQAGAVKTALAANNVDTNTGSALDVETGTREKGALNEYTIANNAELQAYGYRTQATNFEAQSALDQSASESDLIGGAIGATGSLMSNASSVGFKWSSGGGGGSSSGLSTGDDAIYTPMGPTGFAVGGA